MQQSVTTIQGDRVLFRPFQEGDAEESARVWTPELRYMYGGSRTAPGRPTGAQRRRGKEQIITSGEHHFAIEADGRYIGWLGLRVNDDEQSGSYRIGIENPEYWGRGYGTEVAGLMLRYAFETLGLHRVHLKAAAYNLRGRRCYEKAGFRVEGILRQSFQVDGEWQDDVLMAILKVEWEARRGDPLGRPTDDVTIRSYRQTDHPAAVALWEASDLHLGGNDTPEMIAWKLSTQPGFFLVAEMDGKIVGTVIGSLERGWGWVQRLAVHPDYRRRGIARRLMQEAEQAHAALGAYRACLLTHRENAAAQALYHGLGYETWEKVIVMSKELAVPEGASGEEGCCGG